MPTTEDVTTGTVDSDDTLIGTQDSTLTRKFTVSSIVAAGVAALIGVSIQAFDADLDALAGVTSAADRLPYFTGAGTATVTVYTAAGRALDDDATAADQRTTLAALGTAGGTLTGPVTGDRGTFVYNATPTLDADANSNYDMTDDLDGNMAVTISNGTTAQYVTFCFRQDGTGSRTVSVACTGATAIGNGTAAASGADDYSCGWAEFRTLDSNLVCFYGFNAESP